ncbi:MAG: methyltransferase domain-containing protein [Eubacterium sp.]|nr:methyltransferase domain-containing protein [Eubacterium sp.]
MRVQTDLEKYYNKFNEDKRLKTRHGQVEFRTTMHYIHEAVRYLQEKSSEIPEFEKIKILDIGAGTGAYSIPLFEEGYDITAVELVKYNLGILKKKCSDIQAFQGNALKLSRFEDNTFDLCFLFGPMYHLFTEEDQLKALLEAKRVTREGGTIMAAYVMNEYSVITYAFKEGYIMECLKDGRFTPDYRIIPKEKELYHYMRIEDINALNEKAGLKRRKIISADGPSDYIRPVLNSMDDNVFEEYFKYHMAICERQDLIGATSHTVDILEK